ncbi:hypothetical protein BGZ97_007531 [Linnemannia gamsii]|jgi:hypothetical protein|uniref:Uncharacterized protein n=1 Tax=Linnemannia gamsii TaxID=64522 RepID=A0A9P6QS32_9FUNG|nr:hypothetical protein BGZ97_007531 [Linnemannia gamsii]
MEQQPPVDPKAASTYSSTTVTSTTGAAAEPQPSVEMFAAKILQGELQRKLEQLQDVHSAYRYLTTHWTDQKDGEAAAVHQHGYIVQQCWLSSLKTQGYRDRLETAVDKLEREICEIRVEFQSIAKTEGRK